MKTATFIVLTLTAAVAARADFSYTTTRKSSGGMAAMAGGSPTTKHYFKGQKTKTDTGDTAFILDFDAQTITNVNHKAKTYTVTKFSDLGAGLKGADVEAKIDVKETGQKKTINGFNASEVVMTMEVDTPQSTKAGVKMQMEMDMWLSSDVPGAKEVRAFYQKNAANFPWAALAGGAGAQKGMADMQKKMATIGGVPVLQIVKMKSAGAGAEAAQAQMAPAQAQARAKLEAMIQQGGQQAEFAKQALARMGGTAAGGGGSLFEVTTESSDFSANSIPDSEFAIPAGYTKSDKPAIPGR